MGKFGKNDWKIKAYYIGTAVITGGIILILAVNAPRLAKQFHISELADSAQNILAKDNYKGNQDHQAEEIILDTEAEAVSEVQVSNTQTDTSSVEETRASLLEEELKMNEGFYQIPVVAASATSTISQENTNNTPMMLFDGRDDTTWQEGVNGYGIGESVSFSFDGMHKVKYIGFKLGNWKNEKYYLGNAMPKTMTLVFGDYTGQITFRGTKKEIEWVEVNNLVNADSMKITIDDIYPGTSWEDTCITEILVYGVS